MLTVIAEVSTRCSDCGQPAQQTDWSDGSRDVWCFACIDRAVAAARAAARERVHIRRSAFADWPEYIARALVAAGYQTPAAVAGAADAELLGKRGIGAKVLAEVRRRYPRGDPRYRPCAHCQGRGVVTVDGDA